MIIHCMRRSLLPQLQTLRAQLGTETDLGLTQMSSWPQDPYFAFSSLIIYVSWVWKCESTLIFFLVPSSTLLRGVEVWKSLTKVGYCHTFLKCGKVQQSQDIGAFFSQSQTPFFFYLLLHFSEVCQCAVVWQTEFNVALSLDASLFHSSTPLRRVELSKEW